MLNVIPEFFGFLMNSSKISCIQREFWPRWSGFSWFSTDNHSKNFDRTLIWKVRMVQSLAYWTFQPRWTPRRSRCCSRLSWKVRSARDRTIRTFQIGVRSEFLESKENHEKPLHRSGMRPKIQEGAIEKGNKLPWGSEADYALAPIQMMLYLPSKVAMLAFTKL